MADERLEPEHVHSDGFLEVNPVRMKNLEQHVSRWDQKRIIANRNDYLTWMQKHFAPIVVSSQQREE